MSWVQFVLYVVAPKGFDIYQARESLEIDKKSTDGAVAMLKGITLVLFGHGMHLPHRVAVKCISSAATLSACRSLSTLYVVTRALFRRMPKTI